MEGGCKDSEYSQLPKMCFQKLLQDTGMVSKDVYKRQVRSSAFVVEGICYTPQMKALWKRMQQNEYVGITDVYKRQL